MSDTSGRINFGTVKTKIRLEIRKRRSGEPTNRKPISIEREKPTKTLNTDLPRELVWNPLHEDGLLEKAFIDSELIPFLKQMAQFIETTAIYGLDAVGREFEVEGETAFSTLQRNIREKMALQTTTEFDGAAKRAFQVGSTKWAAKLLNQTDPTKFKINMVVKAVRRDVNYALILSPALILRDYGERLLIGALPGGNTNKKVVDDAIDGYHQQFDDFMKEHSTAEEWGSQVISNTVGKYVKLLLK
jgi:hypothetical protein